MAKSGNVSSHFHRLTAVHAIHEQSISSYSLDGFLIFILRCANESIHKCFVNVISYYIAVLQSDLCQPNVIAVPAMLSFVIAGS